MVRCTKCSDPYDEYRWYEDMNGKYKFGLRIDENLYREHICKPDDIGPKKYWCIKCNAPIPYKNLCIHRRQQLNPEKKKIGYF